MSLFARRFVKPRNALSGTLYRNMESSPARGPAIATTLGSHTGWHCPPPACEVSSIIFCAKSFLCNVQIRFSSISMRSCSITTSSSLAPPFRGGAAPAADAALAAAALATSASKESSPLPPRESTATDLGCGVLDLSVARFSAAARAAFASAAAALAAAASMTADCASTAAASAAFRCAAAVALNSLTSCRTCSSSCRIFSVAERSWSSTR
mmetsp:Transcript_78288/g.221364  ORF Transcript_78288/g.221364 Transcript_78288/m.221364 type:complete len:211 (-) Transcript_78288:1308-1940(-)